MMKKLLYFLLLGSMLSSCSNDFEVSAPWKEVPIAYALLSPKDSAHYIRIEKAFLDPNISALEIAQIADSLYYPENDIAVWLEHPSASTRVQLHRVDGNLEGYVRKEGVFADQPNWLYKVKGSPLAPGEKYRLVIERKDGKPDITAETTVPKDFTLFKPSITGNVRFMSFAYSTTTTVDWRTDENGVYFNLYLIIPYREEAADGTLLGRDTLVWTAATNFERSNTQSGGQFKATKEVAGAQLFDFLAANIPATSTNFRYFEKGSIIIEGGGKEIKEFNVTAAANSGLTGAEVYPVYTNLSEGFGIFTAKNELKINNVIFTGMSGSTIDSMDNYLPTRLLQFKL